jgi:hypothetical protein
MTAIQEMVWQRMLQVEFNAVYWDKKAFWLSFRLRSLQLLLALIGCTAFVSLFGGPSFGLFNKVLTVLAVGLGLYLSHLIYGLAFSKSKRSGMPKSSSKMEAR